MLNGGDREGMCHQDTRAFERIDLQSIVYTFDSWTSKTLYSTTIVRRATAHSVLKKGPPSFRILYQQVSSVCLLACPRHSGGHNAACTMQHSSCIAKQTELDSRAARARPPWTALHPVAPAVSSWPVPCRREGAAMPLVLVHRSDQYRNM